MTIFYSAVDLPALSDGDEVVIYYKGIAYDRLIFWGRIPLYVG